MLSEVHELKERVDFPLLAKYAELEYERLLRQHHEDHVKKNFFIALEEMQSLVLLGKKEESLEKYFELKKAYRHVVNIFNHNQRMYFYEKMQQLYIGIDKPKVRESYTQIDFVKLRSFLEQNEFEKASNLYKDMYS